MTQSGLILGKRKNKGAEKIVGISVARDKVKEEEIIKRYLDSCGEMPTNNMGTI